MAILEFDKDSEIERIWFVGDGHSRDWMAVVWRKSAAQPWEVTYRFRYYKSAEAWPEAAGVEGEDDDVKNVYGFACKLPDQDEAKRKMIEATDFVSQMTLEHMGPTAERWVVPVQGGQDKFLAVMRQQPWAHMKSLEEKES